VREGVVRGEVRGVMEEQDFFSDLYGAHSGLHVRTIALKGLLASITDF
jgi:hypothetical protein